MVDGRLQAEAAAGVNMADDSTSVLLQRGAVSPRQSSVDNGGPGKVSAAIDEHSSGSARKSHVPVRRRVLDRALPGPIIDVIRDGVPASDLRKSGGRAVYKALWRTAASACQRGIDQWEWEVYVLEPQSQLGRQVRLRDGRTPLPKERVRKTLDNVWEQATAWVSEQEPPATRQELLLRGRPNLTAARRKLEDPQAPLSSADRLVLDFACSEIERRGLERVTLPWRSVCGATRLGERTAKNSLRRLVAGRHLLVAVPGKAGQGASRRASIYRLPDVPIPDVPIPDVPISDVPIPEDGSMGPPAQFYGTPTFAVVGTPQAELLLGPQAATTSSAS